jgi:hypothetical protein
VNRPPRQHLANWPHWLLIDTCDQPGAAFPGFSFGSGSIFGWNQEGLFERRTMRVSGSQKLLLIAWAALGAIATIGWFYFIAISFRFIIDLL